MYDLIGDIHGCCRSLEALLEELGYRSVNGVYRHPDRKVIFLGDFIDRGPDQRGVIEIVRPMIESGSARSVMGNHEFNAIAFATPDPTAGGYYRAHSPKNRRQHEAFLSAYPEGSTEYRDTVDWFRTLPLWLEVNGLRVVHACWDQQWIDRIIELQSGSAQLGEELLRAACFEDNWQFEALETLLKGKEIPLADGASFRDKDGNVRHSIRIRWWDSSVTTFREAYMGPESALTHIPDDEIEGDHLIEYRHDAPPLFLGHYWRTGTPEPLSANIACLDYSVGKPGGNLVAYRWDGEARLSSDRFVSVDRQEP